MPFFVEVRENFVRDGGIEEPYWGPFTIYRDNFARFKTIQRKPNLASAFGISKEN